MQYKPFRNSKWVRALRSYCRIPLRLRFLNWLVQRVIYRTPHLRFSLHFASRVTHADRLVISKSAAFSLAQKGGCYLGCSNGVEIGEGTIIASGVTVISANHKFEDFTQHVASDPVRIGKNCWLAAHAIILPGVQLGDNVIVGAGAVVTRSFPSGSVLVGVPARSIGSVRGSAASSAENHASESRSKDVKLRGMRHGHDL